MLRRGAKHLSEHGWRRLRLRLELGDTHGEIAVAWVIAQDLRRLYQADTLDAARRHLDQLLAAMTSCPVPEVGRLGRTLTSGRAKILAYWTTDEASNGPTEAINLVIEKVRRIGHGYRNMRNYRLRLLLFCGTTWQTLETTRIRSRRPRNVA